MLGWGWIIATITANMIWCMPQFSLCFAALEKNLIGLDSDGNSIIGNSKAIKIAISLNILFAAAFVVLLSSRGGRAAKVFDWILKALVGVIVLCFFGVVVYMGIKGHLAWGKIFSGFVPDLRQWSQPTGEVATLVNGLSDNLKDFWTDLVVKSQRDVMIGAAATAVGINMTFLMPYAMLSRGWNKPFRGLARFDLCTGLAIPYIVVTSCVVIAAAQSFHGQVDQQLLSNNPVDMQDSPLFNGAKDVLLARVRVDDKAGYKSDKFDKLADDEKAKALSAMAALSGEEKRLSGSVVERNAWDLSMSLAPLLGQNRANVVFGLGIFGMGFSTIMILMLINGYAFSEMFGKAQGGRMHIVGCLVAGIAGASWPFVRSGDSKIWLAILVSGFGMMLLPIAYLTFFMMMNSKRLMGKEKPKGARMAIWNVLMGISVVGACVAAGTSIYDKAKNPKVGTTMIIVLGVFAALVIVGFFLKPKSEQSESEEPTDKVASSE